MARKAVTVFALLCVFALATCVAAGELDLASFPRSLYVRVLLYVILLLKALHLHSCLGLLTVSRQPRQRFASQQADNFPPFGFQKADH